MLREIEKQTFSPKFPEPICHMRLILRLADAGVMKRYFIENGRFTFAPDDWCWQRLAKYTDYPDYPPEKGYTTAN